MAADLLHLRDAQLRAFDAIRIEVVDA